MRRRFPKARRVAAWLMLALPVGCGQSAPVPADAGLDGRVDGAPLGDARTDGAGMPDGAVICPGAPPALEHWVTGDPEDRDVTPLGPGLILMGGGPDVDEAFTWWQPLLSGGDVVVLRASGADGYNDYLYSDLGGVDSVETLKVDGRALADDPYVSCRVRQAEGVFIAGGDQSDYVAYWTDTALNAALQDAWARGAVLGGTSAGCAVLGQFAFSAENGTVYSDEALTDPYNTYMTLAQDFLALPPLAAIITDTHFGARDRMGRLVGFVARILADGLAGSARGLGVDEATALVVGPEGVGTVLGAGNVYFLRSTQPPTVCQPGQPLDHSGLLLHRLAAGDSVELPSGETTVPSTPLAVGSGVLTPATPY